LIFRVNISIKLNNKTNTVSKSLLAIAFACSFTRLLLFAKRFITFKDIIKFNIFKKTLY